MKVQDIEDQGKTIENRVLLTNLSAYAALLMNITSENQQVLRLAININHALDTLADNLGFGE